MSLIEDGGMMRSWQRTSASLLAMTIGSLQISVTRASEDIEVGSPEVNYVDPEFDSARNWMTFQDGTGDGASVWVGWLDPETGKLDPETGGRDVFIGDGVTTIWRTLQGPEWIRDSGRAEVFYTATDGIHPNLWVSRVIGGSPELVLPPDGFVRTSLSGTQSGLDRVKLVYFRSLPDLSNFRVCWTDLAVPGVENVLTGVTFGDATSAPTWTRSRFLVYTKRWDGVSQITQYDTALGEELALTSSAGDKFGPWSWEAPELSGRRLFIAVSADSTRLFVYRRVSLTDPKLGLIATLAAPAAAGNQVYIHSAEPFVSGERSYVSLILQDEAPGATSNATRGSVWVWGVPTSSGVDFVQTRVDGDLGVRPIDPESYVTPYGVFIYYYHLLDAGLGKHVELRRCTFRP